MRGERGPEGRLPGRGDGGGADSIEDMDVLRHGAMAELFGGIRAPSTLGSFLRSFTWGNVRQLEPWAGGCWRSWPAGQPLLPGADVLAFIDMDSTQKRVYGHAKQGAGFGHTKIQGKSLLVRGLNALAAVICTPLAAPVIAAARLRGGTANSARGARPAGRRGDQRGPAGRVHRDLIVPDRLGVLLRRGAAARSAPAGRASRSPCRCDAKVRAAIAAISEDAWTPITYPRAIWDEDQGRLISDAAGRRGALHGVRVEEGQGDHRPADRPPGPRPEPPGRRRAGRAVPCLALPRRVHRLAVRA